MKKIIGILILLLTIAGMLFISFSTSIGNHNFNNFQISVDVDYSATYSFTNDTIGNAPNGWINYSGSDCSTTIIEELGGHSKVLKIEDNSATEYASIYNNFDNQTFGTIEFWHRTPHVSHILWMTINEGGTPIIVLRCAARRYDYHDTTDIYWHLVEKSYNNIWYHHRLDFNCESKTFDWYINATLVVDDGGFQNDPKNGINQLVFSSIVSNTSYINYIDAVGYSWDPNYTIGDNQDSWDEYIDHLIAPPLNLAVLLIIGGIAGAIIAVPLIIVIRRRRSDFVRKMKKAMIPEKYIYLGDEEEEEEEEERMKYK